MISVDARKNARLSLDSVPDQFACVERRVVLNTFDHETRECLVAITGTSISGRRVVRQFTDLIVENTD